MRNKTREIVSENERLIEEKATIKRMSRSLVDRYIESTAKSLEEAEERRFVRRQHIRLPRLGSVEYGNIKFVSSRTEEVRGVMIFRELPLVDIAVEFYPEAEIDPMLSIYSFNEDCQTTGVYKRYANADEIANDIRLVLDVAEISAATKQAVHFINPINP